MRIKAVVSNVLISLFLSACDYNTPQDYNPKADFQNFLKKQEEAQKTSQASPTAYDEMLVQPSVMEVI